MDGKVKLSYELSKNEFANQNEVETYFRATDIWYSVEDDMADRKSTTSTAVKARYNNKVYDVISVRVPKKWLQHSNWSVPKQELHRHRLSKMQYKDFLNESWRTIWRYWNCLSDRSKKGNDMNALSFLAAYFICSGIVKLMLALVAERKERSWKMIMRSIIWIYAESYLRQWYL